ncbi:hypothetical protein M011DRAFT_464227 [Sporormia fimetaria CBS 119925]|uniref:Uncharacterized protein n=1 Tax=Sporormia fimetaria CBS 119925 TaxID=1340428 RepID=A0A6A6VQD9_9PLEO|nr:hypothetical protein M011DRAFT_464227 [Sporormia fimetaria CBS 119925]
MQPPVSIFTGTSAPSQPQPQTPEQCYRLSTDPVRDSPTKEPGAPKPPTPLEQPRRLQSSTHSQIASSPIQPSCPRSGPSDQAAPLPTSEPTVKTTTQSTALKTPPAVGGKKRPRRVDESDALASETSKASWSEPLHKRRRLPTRSRHTLDHFYFPHTLVTNGQPPSPLFFSNSIKRPHLPARFSSSEAAARMLSKTRGEETAIKTVTLPRGSYSGISPPGATSVPSTRSSDRSSLPRTSSPDAREKHDAFRLLGSVGIVELLENDTRPTFVIDIAEASNYTPGSNNVHILFANSALRFSSTLWELIAGPISNVQDEERAHAAEQFKGWMLTPFVQGSLQEGNPSSIEHGGIVWSAYTLRRRLRVISGAVPPNTPAVVPSTRQTLFPIPSASSGHITANGAEKHTGQHSEAMDYFGDSVATTTEECADDKPTPDGTISEVVQPGSLDTTTTDTIGITLKPNKIDLTTPHSILPHNDDDIGFFDWTRLPLSPSLPRHIQFARSVDWASTSLGPIEFWSNDLRAMCNLIMASPHPAAMYWGEELVAIYNEAYIGLAGQKHPQLMGQSYKDAWAEIWDDVKDVFNNARLTGQATMKDDDCLFMKRHGFMEETYFSWSIIPIVGGDGTVAGLYNPAFEKTRRKIAERRMLTLREVGERTATARDVKSFWGQVLEGLTENERDTPFALIYSVSDDNGSDCSSLHSASLFGNKTCYLEGALGVPSGHPCAPDQMDLKEGTDGFAPVFREVMKTDKPVVMSIGSGDLPLAIMEDLEWRGFGDPCRDVVVCPIHPTTGEAILGFLVVGVNPRRPFDDDYNLFIQLLGRQLGTSLASVVLFEEEIRRGQKAAKLAAEDRFNLSEQLAMRTQEARDSETRFTRMAEYSGVGLFIANHEGYITYCNDSWYEITRVPKDTQKTSQWMDYVKDEDRWIVEEHWKGLVENAQSINVEFRFKTPWEDRHGNKGDTWVLFSAFPETYQEGGLRSIFGSLTNISSQKWAEDFQKRKMEEAVELKRQQENFIDITSHEMRNPLSAILQCADEIATILSDYRPPKAAPVPPNVVVDSIDAAQTIALCAQHQKRIVDDVLTLSKLDSAMLIVTPVDSQPLQVVQRALKMFEGEVQSAGIKMEFVVDDSFKKLNVDWVKVDPSRVLQVLINLTTNAIKFTTNEEERTIRVILSASRERPSASPSPTVAFFPTRAKDNDQTRSADWGDGEVLYLEFAVEDTGRGLTPEEKKLLFQRFSQASPRTHVQYGGSGLGLFISRQLAEIQGGEIGVSSEAGKGSTFAFYVKCRRSTKPPERPDTAPSVMEHGMGELRDRRQSVRRTGSYAHPTNPDTVESTAADRSHLKVLIVEDNLVNQKVLQRQLHNKGITAHVANHGGEALEKIKESWYWKANAPDAPGLGVVLMDKEMPVMDGLHATSQIREWEEQGLLRSHVPIIAVTANARSEQVSTLRTAGMDDVVSKPFRITELIPKIEALSSQFPDGLAGRPLPPLTSSTSAPSTS